jgi:ABC-2 type transport system ATP-binding protein
MNLSVRHLRKQFATTLAVDDVAFNVTQGEVFGLLGPNGAGKTTTIRMILRILEPDAGTVLYEGRPFSEDVRNHIGYLPEERGLYRKSKVLDTILYFAQLRGMSPRPARQEALHWMKRLAIDEYAGRKVEELSKGNQQKVQFVIAIIHNPSLVVLDEPFSGLDPVNQIVLTEVFRELKQSGKAVIFSTHQMDQAEKLSDALCLINKGKVVLGGALRDVKKQYGSNSLHLEFEGDGAFMTRLPGVRSTLMFENTAELDLAPDATARDIIALVNPRVELRKVELREPSLQSIFLRTVGGPATTGKENAA